MAALPVIELTKRLPLGDRSVKALRVVTGVGLNAADEWAETGLSTIEAVLGWVQVGQVPGAAISIRKNAAGTGVTEGTDPGKLAIESTVASTILEITVLGLP